MRLSSDTIYFKQINNRNSGEEGLIIQNHRGKLHPTQGTSLRPFPSSGNVSELSRHYNLKDKINLINYQLINSIPYSAIVKEETEVILLNKVYIRF